MAHRQLVSAVWICHLALALLLLSGGAYGEVTQSDDTVTGWVESEGLRIFYQQHGGSGPPLLLVHGWGSNSTSNWVDTGWVAVLEDLRTVISIDVRGHGKSAKPHALEPYSYRAMAADVIAVMDALEIEQADYLGYSMGAFMGVALLADYPERFSTMVLGGIGNETKQSAQQGALIGQALRSTEPPAELGEYALGVRQYVLADAQNDLLALAYSAERMWPDGYPLKIAGDDISRAQFPVLIVNGAQDHPYVDSADLLAAALANGQHVQIPDSDHLSVVINPQFKEIVRGFLAAQPSLTMEQEMNRMAKLGALKWLAGGVIYLCSVGAWAAPPNIIFILTDDQRFDELGFMNPLLETPSMDALAAQGVHFSNAFVTTSLCSPSRASILTGQMMHSHGVVDNNSPLPPAMELFPARLQAAGYQTAFIGKWHMGGAGSEPRPEFDYWVSFPGQGTYYPENASGGVTQLNVNGQEVAQSGYITDELTDYTLAFLAQRDANRPFFAYLSHKAVHAMFEPAERHAQQYSGSEVKLGEPPARDTDVPMWVLNQRNSWHGQEFPYHSELPLKEFKRQYHRTLSAVDDSLGRIRAWLQANDLAENTIVILMGDNGFMFGEHGLIDKRNAYEESMRVPLIVHGPGIYQAGQVVTEMVANIDIAPTILSLAGVELPVHYDGLSFASLPTGPGQIGAEPIRINAHGLEAASGDGERQQGDQRWREHLVYEYYWEFNYPQTPTVFAIRTERFKYIQYHGVWDTEELFDLVADPQEQVNLIESAAHLQTKVALRQQLYRGLADRDGRNVVPYTRKFNQGAVFRHEDRSRAAEFPEKWLRGKQAADRWEHVIPDGPGKAARLRVVDEVLKDR